MHRYLREPVNSLTHLLGAVLALLGLIWLLVITYPDVDRIIVSLVYGISVILTFTASGVMHLYKGSNRMIDLLIRLDHAAIYLMIAGTYTPIAYVYLDSVWFMWMMVAIWGMALGGVVWKIFFFQDNSIWSLLYYLAMGWFSLILLPHLFPLVDIIGFSLIVGGGVSYTIGAIIFGIKRPNFNRWWGYHEIWHLFVLGGFAFHFFGVLYYMAS
ncbi:MAG: hemolysin III family protein [Phototrophicaceae bacterium]